MSVMKKVWQWIIILYSRRPSYVAEQGEDSDWRLSGKVGGNFQATDALGVYGEISLLTADEDTDLDNSWGTKVGVKYAFWWSLTNYG